MFGFLEFVVLDVLSNGWGGFGSRMGRFKIVMKKVEGIRGFVFRNCLLFIINYW